MITKNLWTIALGTFLLSGCGGGDNTDMDDIKNKKYLFVYHNLKSGICETEEYINVLYNNSFRDIVTKQTGNSTTCASLGKNETNCAEYYFTLDNTNYGNTVCLLGFNEAVDFSLF